MPCDGMTREAAATSLHDWLAALVGKLLGTCETPLPQQVRPGHEVGDRELLGQIGHGSAYCELIICALVHAARPWRAAESPARDSAP